MYPILTLQEHFAELKDPRVERTKLHRLVDILVIVLCEVLAGASSWDDNALVGETHEAWLETCPELPTR